MKKRILFSLIFIICFLLVSGTNAIPVRSDTSKDWPQPFLVITKRVTVAHDDPYIELLNEALSSMPILQLILDNATYWAQQNMNETQHWGISYDDMELIFAFLNAKYVDKFGLNASQYAAIYGTTFTNPIVKYAGFYFAIIDGRAMGHVLPMLITQVYPQEEDAYVDWNCTCFGGRITTPLETALDTAVNWSQYGINEIVHYFNSDIYHDLKYAFEWAYNDKYGMHWHEYYLLHNTTVYGPTLSYKGYYFEFTSGMPEAIAPNSQLITLLIISSVIGFGLVLLGLTLINFRRLRSEPL